MRSKTAICLELERGLVWFKDRAMTKKSAEEDFVSIAVAAATLGVYPGTIRRYFDRGLLEGKTMPFGRRKISRKSLEELARRIERGEKIKE